MKALIIIAFSLALYVCLSGCKKDEKPIIEKGTVTDMEGNVYETVKIGGHEWMIENLRTKHLSDEDELAYVYDGLEWQNTSVPAYTYYNNNEDYALTHGALYNWYAVNTRKLCPDGWRVPTDDDWKKLEGKVDSNFGIGDAEWDKEDRRGFDAGLRLKSTTGWALDGSGTDMFEFSAHPSGFRATNGDFEGFEYVGQWWTSTEISEYQVYRRKIYHDDSRVGRYPTAKGNGYSVRCVRNIE